MLCNLLITRFRVNKGACFCLYLVTCLPAFLFIAYAEDPAYRPTLRSERYLVELREDMHTRSQELFQKDTLLWFRSRSHLERLLNSIRTSHPDREKIIAELLQKALPIKELTTKDQNRMANIYGAEISRMGVVIKLSEKEWQSVPESILYPLHNTISHEERGITPMHMFSSYEDAIAEFKKYGMSQEQAQHVLENSLPCGEHPRICLFYFKNTEKYLSESYRKRLFAEFGDNLNDRKNREGVKVRVLLHDDKEIEKIAHYYANGRPTKPIERYLKQASQQKGGFPVEIELDKILQPMIRDTIHTFADPQLRNNEARRFPVVGPNCYNCAVETQSIDRNYDLRFINSSKLLDSLKDTHRALDPKESLMPNDVLLYMDDKNNVIHAVTYFGEGQNEMGPFKIVYTKNGRSRYSPYMFADKDIVDFLYSQASGTSQKATKIIVLRSTSDMPERSTAMEWKNSGKDFTHPYESLDDLLRIAQQFNRKTAGDYPIVTGGSTCPADFYKISERVKPSSP